MRRLTPRAPIKTTYLYFSLSVPPVTCDPSVLATVVIYTFGGQAARELAVTDAVLCYMSEQNKVRDVGLSAVKSLRELGERARRLNLFGASGFGLTVQ